MADSTRRLLELEGCVVRCAFDGQTGLDLAKQQQYEVILLDRRVPKLSGDQVLEQLRRSGNLTPVVIMTGFPDVDSAFHAGRLHATSYLTKSAITGRELVTAVRSAARPAVPVDRPVRLFGSNGCSCSRAFADLVGSVQHDSADRSQMLGSLANAISAREVTFIQFLAAAKSFYLLHRTPPSSFSNVLSTVQAWLTTAATTSAIDPRLERVLDLFQAAGKTWITVTEVVAAKNLAVDVSDLWKLFAEQLGLTFVQCRRATVMRRAVMELLDHTEHVRQVAYRVGYSEHGNFDHDFRQFFGLAPTAFRRLLEARC